MIKASRDEGVLRLLLDRPERRNALDWDMIVALGDALAAAESDPGCRCVVLAGAGGHFAAGRDLAAASGAGGLPGALERDAAWTRIFQILHRLPVPSVAVVQGYAVAGGFTLAMACDFVLAERNARFGAFEMRNGFPAAVNTPVLTRLLGPRLALELLLFGDLVAAPRLYELGLVNRLAETAEALAAIEADFVGRLVALDPDAVRLTKETHRAVATMPLEAGLVMGKQLNALIAASGRLEEAAASFARRQGERSP